MTRHPGAAFYLSPPRAWELMSGAVLAFSSTQLNLNEKWAHPVGLLGLAAILCSVLFFTEDTQFPGPWALLPVLGASLVILAGARDRTASARILSSRPLRALGAISYSLYLWHWPILVFGTALLPYQMVPGVKFGLLALALGVSYLSWRFVETPFRKPAGHFSRRTVFLLAAGLGGLLIVASYMISAQRGYPGRFAFSVPDTRYEEQYRLGTCLLQSPEGVSSYRLQNCKSGDPNHEPNSLLWGDSHAAHYTTGLASFGGRHAFSFYQANLGGCPPLVGETRVGENCRRFNDDIISLLRDQPHIENVILAANWEVYARNQDLLPALKETLAALHGMGKTIVLIGPGPNFEMDVPSLYQLSMSRYGTWRGDKFQALKDETLGVAFHALGELPSVSVVLPYDILCTDKSCRVYENGEFVFWDTNHLTPYGSALISENIYRALLE